MSGAVSFRAAWQARPTHVDGKGVAFEEEAQIGVADEHRMRYNLHERGLQTRATVLDKVGSEATYEIQRQWRRGEARDDEH